MDDKDEVSECWLNGSDCTDGRSCSYIIGGKAWSVCLTGRENRVCAVCCCSIVTGSSLAVSDDIVPFRCLLMFCTGGISLMVLTLPSPGISMALSVAESMPQFDSGGWLYRLYGTQYWSDSAAVYLMSSDSVGDTS